MIISNYTCHCCGKRGVKLWLNKEVAIMICAECAEKMQAPREAKEYIWTKTSGKATGKILKLDPWVVDKDGLIPSDIVRPHMQGRISYLPVIYKNKLLIFTPAYSSNIPNAEENWKKTPTRI